MPSDDDRTSREHNQQINELRAPELYFALRESVKIIA